MSETITEMILPGTYIEVRAEGLIGVGGISTGNIGVVGTANKGPVGSAVVLGDYSTALATFGPYDKWPASPPTTPALTLTRTLEQLFAGGASSVYAVRVANGTPTTQKWAINSASDVALLTLTATSPGSWGAALTWKFDQATNPTLLSFSFAGKKESYNLSTAQQLADDINAGSGFFTASAPTTGNGAVAPAKVVASTTDVGGSDGATAGASDAATGLALLEPQPVNIVVVAGLSANDVGAQVLTHLEHTENDGNERIAVLGASSDDPATLLAADGTKVSSARVVLVAPGLVAEDAASTAAVKTVNLPASYSAAVVAGRLATLAPQVSLTNKDVPVEDLTTHYSRAQQKQLLGGNVLVLAPSLGMRVVKGITTDTGAFKQISVRRIVDYAKAGVRIGANPYIGRLNNERVRAALKATLDGFLSGMVLDEMLVAYTLDVSATRAQQIAGIALVTMTLQPTFSIDYIKVIMNLS
jgi:hypothetical protein